MDDLLTGELQPVRRAPPPPRLAAPSTRKNVANNGNGVSFPSQLPPPLPRTLSSTPSTTASSNSSNGVKSLFNGSLFGRTTNGGSTRNKLQHSPSLPVVSSSYNKNGAVNNSLILETTKKKAPPPRPPPPKINNKTQRLGGRRHDNLTSGGQGFPLSGSRVSTNHHSPTATETLLIDFSPPPRSPSLAASGSDGVSVNSFGSESSGTFFDAPTSWLNGGGSGRIAAPNGGNTTASGPSNGFGANFDPFGSIEEEPQRLREVGGGRDTLDNIHVGRSSFYDGSSFNSTPQTAAKPTPSNTNGGSWCAFGPRYDPDVLQADGSSSINWDAFNSSSIQSPSTAPPADPFSPRPSSTVAPVQRPSEEQPKSTTSEAEVSRNTKPKYRPTIIRTKPPSEDPARKGALVDILTEPPSTNSRSVHHSTSAPAPLSSFGGNAAPSSQQGGLHGTTNDQSSSSKESSSATIDQVVGGSSSSVNDTPPDGGTYAVAEFDYASNEPGDLCLKVGDRVELVAAISDDWLEGRLHGRQGLFPTAFVKILGSNPISEKAPSPVPVVLEPTPERPGPNEVTALYSFTAELPTDLTLQEGATVTVTGVVEGGQWLLGHCSGRSGQFPSNFVSHIPDNLPVITL